MARKAKNPGDDPRPWKFTMATVALGIILAFVGLKVAEARGMLSPFALTLFLAAMLSICLGGIVHSNWKDREVVRQNQQGRSDSLTSKR